MSGEPMQEIKIRVVIKDGTLPALVNALKDTASVVLVEIEKVRLY